MPMPSMSNQQSATSGTKVEAGLSFNNSGFNVNYGNEVPWYVWAGLIVGGYLWFKGKR